MIPSRVTVFTALFNLAQTAIEFQTVSQRFIPWNQLSDSQKPALTLWESEEDYSYPKDPLQKLVLTAHLIAYFAAPLDLTIPPVQDIDNALDAFDAVFAPSTGQDKMVGRQTLGGLVYDARIKGKVIKASGDLDGTSALIVPFEITVAQKRA